MSKEKSSGMSSVIAALIANMLVAISKFVGFFISGSTAMLNESIHSVVDCANQVLLLVGNKQAGKGQSDLHQFGEARAKYFFSTIVATMLFFGGGVLGVMEAIRSIGHPEHAIGSPWLIIVILIIGTIVEAFSFRVALKEIAELNTDKLPIYQFLKESRHSEILIIFIEDLCAVVGLAIAFIGTLLTIWTGNYLFDAITGLLIGILLMGAACFLAKEFYSLMIGESVTKGDLAAIRQAFGLEEISHVLDIRTVHLGPDEILVAAKIDLVHQFEEQAPVIINQIEDQIRTALPDKKLYIYIEVDEFDPNYQPRD
ncbi:MAG: cation diffusion facilitator family transporter [Turicibacter sp.]|nr:cation diffusion facilitator family transporter [Turicibacter sp.]